MKKRKLSVTQLVRHLIQLAAFLLAPGLFITVFSDIGSIYKAVISGGFSFAAFRAELLLVAAVLLITALWGRFFCGFLCSFGAMGDLIWGLTHIRKKRGAKISPPADAVLKYVKYLVLIFTVLCIWTLAIPTGELWSPWTVFGMYATVQGFPAAKYLLSLGALLLLIIMLGSAFVERFFCRYFCPLGAIFSLISRFRLFRIKKPTDGCGGCRLCTARCSMGIALYRQDAVRSGECIDCFKCTGCCPRDNVSASVSPALAGTLASAALLGAYYAAPLLPDSAAEPGYAVSSGVSAAGGYADGVYTGTGEGYRGEVTVQVTVENGAISDITLVSKADDEKFFSSAWDGVTGAVIAAQSAEVDAVSGATFSSNGIMEAVADALEQSGTGEQSAAETPAATAAPADEAQESAASASSLPADGVYTGTGTGLRGEIKVSVTVSGGRISAIEVLSYEDDEQFFTRAESGVIDSVIAAQSAEVDAVSGATFSSNGIMEAVANALGQEYTNTNSSASGGGHGHGGRH